VILFANLVRKIRDENPLLEKTKDVRKGKRRFGWKYLGLDVATAFIGFASMPTSPPLRQRKEEKEIERGRFIAKREERLREMIKTQMRS
jgi:hypothetical protein